MANSDKEYLKISSDILEAVGGENNVISMAHCATRLRLVVKDRSIIDDEKVDKIDKVKGFFFHVRSISNNFWNGYCKSCL